MQAKTAPIYHMCKAEEWQQAQRLGQYFGNSQDQADGFIHFSDASQIKASAAKHRAGQTGLVLLAVDPQKLGDTLKFEPARNGQLYPHVYNGLNLDAVLWVKDLPWDADLGLHLFPLED